MKLVKSRGPSAAQTAVLTETGAPVDLLRVQVLDALAESGGALPVSKLAAALPEAPARSLARTLSDAAKEGLVEIEGERVSLTSFGFRVLKSF